MSGITIIADSGTQFEAGAAEYNSIDRLDDNNYVIAYRDNNDFNYGKVNVGSRTGTSVTISESNAVVFNADDTDLITVRKMSSTLIVISYRDVNSNVSYVICATISGTTITVGAAKQVDGTSQTESVSVAVLDETNIVASRSYSTNTWCYVGSVSGTTITLGNYQQLSLMSYVNLMGLDSTHFINAGSLNTTLYTVIGTVDVALKTISFGGTQSGGTIDASVIPNITLFDSTHFIVGYSQPFTACLVFRAGSINLSTGVVTYGNVLDSGLGATVSHFSICTMGYSFLVSYYTTTDTQGEIRSGTLTGDTAIAWDAQGAVVFDTTTTAYTTLCGLTDDYFILGFKEG